MAEKITNINVEGRVYEFLSGQGVKGACTAPASSWTKPIVLPEGAVLLDGLIMAITFVNGNSVGFSGTKTIYSSDGENFYYDQAKTDPVTFPPVDNYTLEYISGEEYSFSAFPTIVYGDHTMPVRDAKGHITGGAVWNTGDTVICMFMDGMFLMLSAVVSNAVASGDMNPVTSDAVYQALQNVGGGGGAQCDTAGNVQDKVASMDGFVLNTGVTFPITFAASNSYDGKITLNVNGTGAKDVYLNNAVSSSTNKTLNAGSYICRYNGTNYYIDTGYAVTQARNANYAAEADAVLLGSVISDLNDFLQEDVTYAQCTSDRTSNMPSGEVSGTVSVRTTGSYVSSGTYYATYVQIFEGATGAIYQRRGRVTLIHMTVSWQAWQKMLTEADAFNSLHIAKDGSIYADGTMANLPIIKMKDNTSDANGNGIVIGGGGATVIGGGESADTYYSGAGLSAGSEVMVVANDAGITFATNLQSNYASRKEMTMGTDGKLSNPQGFVGDLSGTATSATRLGTIGISNIRIGSAQAKISLNQLMTWLITTKGYIPSGTDCYKVLGVPWDYAGNDILQLTANGVNYELQLAGCLIEFMGNATNYNTGRFLLRIHSSPSTSFTVSSGYVKFPVSSVIEYTCNGSSYAPAWTFNAPQMTIDSYPTLQPPSGVDNWIKIGKANTSYGLLPSQSGGAGSGHNYLGTSSWYWKYAYIDQIFCSQVLKVPVGGTHSTNGEIWVS